MPHSEKTPLISFQKITKKFKSKVVIENLDLDIYKNEIIVLVGKSGCGKSTLFKILLGFYKPTSGHILYEKKDLVNEPDKIREIVGFVSQENSFYENLTVFENLSFFAKLYSVPKKEIKFRIDHLLELVNLKHAKNSLSSKISGGMKRRLEFAISLIHNPNILILDEPFTGLDIKIRDELWDVVNEIKQSNVTVLVATHLLNSAVEHSNRVVFLHNKKITKEIDIKHEISKNPNFNLEKKFYEEVER